MNLFSDYQSKIFVNLKKLEKKNLLKIPNQLKCFTIELPPKKEFGEIASGIKDSSSELGNIISMVQNIRDFNVYAGTETFLLDTLKYFGVLMPKDFNFS